MPTKWPLDDSQPNACKVTVDVNRARQLLDELFAAQTDVAPNSREWLEIQHCREFLESTLKQFGV